MVIRSLKKIILTVLLLNRVSSEYVFNIKIRSYQEISNNQLPDQQKITVQYDDVESPQSELKNIFFNVYHSDKNSPKSSDRSYNVAEYAKSKAFRLIIISEQNDGRQQAILFNEPSEQNKLENNFYLDQKTVAYAKSNLKYRLEYCNESINIFASDSSDNNTALFQFDMSKEKLSFKKTTTGSNIFYLTIHSSESLILQSLAIIISESGIEINPHVLAPEDQQSYVEAVEKKELKIQGDLKNILQDMKTQKIFQVEFPFSNIPSQVQISENFVPFKQEEKQSIFIQQSDYNSGVAIQAKQTKHGIMIFIYRKSLESDASVAQSPEFLGQLHNELIGPQDDPNQLGIIYESDNDQYSLKISQVSNLILI